MDKDYKVYRFTFPNGKLYFGITSAVKVQYRWGRGKNYNHLVGKAINKYGWDNVIKEVIASGLSQDEAEAMEIKLIAENDTTNSEHGYNIAKGGKSCSGWVVSDETREKLRQVSKQRECSPETIERLKFYSQHQSEETRRKKSEAMKGKKHTQETKAKISYASLNRSSQAIENHRLGLLGHTVSDETRRKISEAQQGVSKPDWLKEKWRQTALNRTPEVNEKLARSRSKPILCVTTNKLYKTIACASIGEHVSEERICYSCKNNAQVKGLRFYQFPIGTLVENIVKEHPEFIIC